MVRTGKLSTEGQECVPDSGPAGGPGGRDTRGSCRNSGEQVPGLLGVPTSDGFGPPPSRGDRLLSCGRNDRAPAFEVETSQPWVRGSGRARGVGAKAVAPGGGGGLTVAGPLSDGQHLLSRQLRLLHGRCGSWASRQAGDKTRWHESGVSGESGEEGRAGVWSGWLLAKGPCGGCGLAHSPHTRAAVSACGLRAVLRGHRPNGASEEIAAARLWGRPRGHPFTVCSRGRLEFGGSNSLALDIVPTTASAGLAHGLEEDRILDTQMEEARVMSSAQTQPSFSCPSCPGTSLGGGCRRPDRTPVP